MINLFRKPKWQIRYVDETGIKSGKIIILAAKTIAQAKERFHYVFAGKKMIEILSIPD